MRSPRGFSPETGLALLTGRESVDAEIAAEKAAALGRAGRRLETAMTAFRAAAPGMERRLAAYAAAEAVQAYFIQRELMGQRSHAEIIRQHDIPQEILGKIGAKP